MVDPVFLKRTHFLEAGIFGVLLDANGERLAVSLEHSYFDPTLNQFNPKVPPGRYLCQRGMHQLAHMRDPFVAYQVLDVPGHSNILLHKGNYNKDSEGCILLGTEVAADYSMIRNSASAFDHFMQLQDDALTFTLEVV